MGMRLWVNHFFEGYYDGIIDTSGIAEPAHLGLCGRGYDICHDRGEEVDGYIH